ncbi:MAG: helicase-related protein, partial [Acidimicrobiales bacterium]
QAARLDDLIARPGGTQRSPRGPWSTGRGSGPAIAERSASGRLKIYRPRRAEVVERLAGENLLPAIYFVFSRAGCEESVRQCLDEGLRLTTPEERIRIRGIVESYADPLTDDDLAVLGYGAFLASLEAGIAAHHAGMVPPFREAVEACFAEALVKVVFATETLALGINMPARSVVIEELTKFGGAGHQEITASEYTQLTGRAGRRGIDEVGYAAVLCSPFHTFGDVARIAGGHPRALTSSFRPTYNLVVNLVRRHSREDAYTLVSSSFAQYLTDEDLVGELDAVRGVLERRGYLDGWSVTKAGGRLAGLYHEADLLVAEALESGQLDELDPASLAAVASGFCYEARRERDAPLPAPSAKVSRRLEAIQDLSEALAAEERREHLPVSRGVDSGFARLIHDWAVGHDLRRILQPSAGPGRRGRRAAAVMTGGDFVRNIKQVIDLLRQVSMVAERPDTANSARVAAERLLRDVVAASSVVTIPVEHGSIRAGGQAAP